MVPEREGANMRNSAHITSNIVASGYLALCGIVGWLEFTGQLTSASADPVHRYVTLAVWLALAVALYRKSRLAAVVSSLAFPVLAATADIDWASMSLANLQEFRSTWTLTFSAPFQVLFHSAVEFASAGSSSTLAGKAASWLAFFVHVLCLVPVLREILNALRRKRAAAQRAKTLRLPESLRNLYRKHPLRILGLLPGQTSTRQIMQRRDDLRVLIDAEMLPPQDHVDDFVDVAWPGTEPLTAVEVGEAVSAIQNLPDRLSQARLEPVRRNHRAGTRAAAHEGDRAGSVSR